MWAALYENVSSGMRQTRSFISSCAFAKYHPGLCSPFIHSVVSNDSVSGQRRPGSDCAYAQSDLGLRCPQLPEDTFWHGTAQCDLSIYLSIYYRHRFIYYATSHSQTDSTIYSSHALRDLCEQ